MYGLGITRMDFVDPIISNVYVQSVCVTGGEIFCGEN